MVEHVMLQVGNETTVSSGTFEPDRRTVARFTGHSQRGKSLGSLLPGVGNTEEYWMVQDREVKDADIVGEISESDYDEVLTMAHKYLRPHTVILVTTPVNNNGIHDGFIFRSYGKTRQFGPMYRILFHRKVPKLAYRVSYCWIGKR